MSNYPGFYYYQKSESIRIKVRVLRFRSRLFKHDAVVQHLDTGKVETVPLRCLTFGGGDDW